MDSAFFVENIKLRCKAKGVPPTVACKDADVGSSFLSDIKRGQIPSVEKVQKIASYLGCTVSDLLGEKKESTPISENSLDGLVKPLSPAAQQEVLNFIAFKRKQEGLEP